MALEEDKIISNDRITTFSVLHPRPVIAGACNSEML